METKVQEIGSFEIKSSNLFVTDPCYSKDTWCTGHINNAKPGKWNATLLITDETGGWGTRVAEIRINHESAGSIRDYEYSRKDADIGVDSGQAGFFEEESYPVGESTGDYGDEKSFYGRVCKLTHDENDHNVRGGCIEFGAVSSSGYGDGSYHLETVEKDGVTVAARIVFISEEEEEEEEED